MKKTLLFLLAIFILGCGNKKKAPDYVIPFDNMVKIIVDIHITDGMLTVTKIRRDLTRNDTVNFYNEILNEYNYSRHDFDTSLYYYSKHIDQYDLIYDEVLNRLSEKEAEIKETKETQGIQEEGHDKN